MVWHKNDELFDFGVDRSDSSFIPGKGEIFHSRLLIKDATYQDSGNYTCSAQNTIPASVNVFVSKGKSIKMGLQLNQSSFRFINSISIN